jgi:hypothetical protein
MVLRRPPTIICKFGRQTGLCICNLPLLSPAMKSKLRRVPPTSRAPAAPRLLRRMRGRPAAVAGGGGEGRPAVVGSPRARRQRAQGRGRREAEQEGRGRPATAPDPLLRSCTRRPWTTTDAPVAQVAAATSFPPSAGGRGQGRRAQRPPPGSPPPPSPGLPRLLLLSGCRVLILLPRMTGPLPLLRMPLRREGCKIASSLSSISSLHRALHVLLENSRACTVAVREA